MSVICVLAMAIMASREVSGLMGSCREAKKCCEGKDPECGVTKVTVMMTMKAKKQTQHTTNLLICIFNFFS